jgi:predicted neuraminidase
MLEFPCSCLLGYLRLKIETSISCFTLELVTDTATTYNPLHTHIKAPNVFDSNPVISHAFFVILKEKCCKF